MYPTIDNTTAFIFRQSFEKKREKDRKRESSNETFSPLQIPSPRISLLSRVILNSFDSEIGKKKKINKRTNKYNKKKIKILPFLEFLQFHRHSRHHFGHSAQFQPPSDPKCLGSYLPSFLPSLLPSFRRRGETGNGTKTK